MQTKGVFRAGTSGLVLAEPNKQAFPPAFQDQSRLSYYSFLFNSIEINSSFYKIPQGITFRKWAETAGSDFQFTVKLWRGITHAEGFNFKKEDVLLFMRAADQLGNKKGCLLIQLPPKAPKKMDVLEHLLEIIHDPDSGKSWRIALEFRDPKWYGKETNLLLNKFNASLVLHDMPGSVPETIDEKAGFIYLRFHGINGDYKGSYTDAFLKNKAEKIQLWLNDGMDVYAYFNNTIGDAVQNLNTLRKLVE